MEKRFSGLTAVLLFVWVLGLAGMSEAQKYGGTVTLGMYSDLMTTDLHRMIGNPTAQFGMLVAPSLVDFDDGGSFVPGLAESWKVSPDASEYTFFLRKNILFHNGRELTAEDIKKNIERLQDEKTRSPRREEYLIIKKVEAIDKYTVRFYLTGPNAAFLTVLRPSNMFITAPESFESNHPIGAGPFEFVEWKTRQYVKVKRYKNYWKKDKSGNQLPYVDEVILKPIPDDAVRYTALRTGDVDWIWAFPFEQIPEIRKNPPPGIVASIRGGERSIQLNLNCARGPTKDVRVRQAMAYAIDKKELMEGLTWGVAPPEAQKFPRGTDWYFEGIEDPYRVADLAKARQLLKEAGYEKGVPLNMIVRNETFIMNMAALAQAHLKRIGIDLKLEIIDRTTHQARQQKQQFDLYPTHLPPVPDPDDYYVYYRSKADQNYTGYSNPECDKLLEEGRRTGDVAKRKEIYRKVVELINRDLPSIFLGHYPVAQASRTYLKNMKTNSRGDVIWAYGGITQAWLEK